MEREEEIDRLRDGKIEINSDREIRREKEL